MIGWIILALVILFLVIVMFRTAWFRPKNQIPVNDEEVTFDKEAAVSALQQLIRCKTVSSYDPSQEDDREFQKLIDLLPTLYPHVLQSCSLLKLPNRALLFRWQGKEPGEPAVLMAHYDVVPVNEEGWEKPPFDGIIEDGVLWGRGALDTKVSFNGILSGAEALLQQGFTPKNDIYFAFSGGEEVNGQGAVNIVNYFKEQGITPSMVVDEGGAVVENVFPGVSQPCGLIGIAEKGMLNVEYRIKSGGGHASAPKPHTPVGRLSMACAKMETHPFKAHLTKPVAEMFDTLGRYSGFAYRLIFANLWCFGWVLDLLCKKTGGELNALMRTTVAFTQMNGSKAPNVIPPEATMVSNIRLNPMDSVDSALAYIKKTVRDQDITLTATTAMEPSPISRTDCAGWQRVASAVASTWKGCLVAPYLMVQCSDSRHYAPISDRVYRFSAMDMTPEERGTLHGNNERIRLETVARAVEFFIRVMKEC